MTRTERPAILLAGVVAALIIGCSGGPGATANPPTPAPTIRVTPGPTAAPTPSPEVTNVTSAAQAAALVFASDTRWSRMVPLRPDMVGQSSWYEAFEAADGYAVNITVGQGDCMAGCIEQHTWRYHVDSAGTVTLEGEDGEAIDVMPGSGTGDDVLVSIQLAASPTCPVEQVPPDPNCEPAPVKNAEVVIYSAEGTEVGRTTSDDAGNVLFQVPEGAYYVVAATVAGLMATPDAQAFSALGGDQVSLLLGYDTGIR